MPIRTIWPNTGQRNRFLRKLKGLLIQTRGPVGVAPMVGTPADEAYRANWNLAAQGDAITAILTPIDGSTNVEDAFDQAGRLDAEWLRQFITPQAVVLDIGCGIGRIEKHLAPYCARLCGVDVADEMIQRARQWTAGRANVEFYRTSATDLSVFPSATFDFVFSYLVLQHMHHEDAFLALREIARLLKPDGLALLQFPSFHSPVYAATFVRQAVERDHRPVRPHMYTVDFATRLLALAGLIVARVETNPGGTMNEHEIVLCVRRQPETAAR